MRGGFINLPSRNGGTFLDAGIYGDWWSSRGSSTRTDGSAIPSAYVLYFTTTGVGPSAGPHTRYAGFPLRCLSTVLDM